MHKLARRDACCGAALLALGGVATMLIAPSPSSATSTSTRAFDPVCMTFLFNLGYKLATTGNPWKKVPPRWVH